MKAMIFAAGLGTRLKPLTDVMPKALVPVGGKPMLERLILKLKASGFDEVVINIHHLGRQITDFLEANNNFGITIHISDESKYLLDTGGGLKQAAPLLGGGEPFLVHNADILSDVDLTALYRSHDPARAMATLLVSNRTTSRYLMFDRENKLCGWHNRDTGEVKSYFPDLSANQYNEYAFGGIHVMSADIFNRMEEWTGKFSIIDFYISACVKSRIVARFVPGISLFDAGTPEAIEAARKQLKLT
ncbi:MAG: nucleotidyltransferase family protein [Tannerellaceae bacterium]|jgi:NDP-sugar pyrophosphorylase family protein|nr:nucleotidyltransferase family protein [Tannerellaceae bacterium]